MSATVVYTTTDDEQVARETVERLLDQGRRAIMERVHEMAQRGDPLTPKTTNRFAVLAEEKSVTPMSRRVVDGKIEPCVGDLARVLTDVKLEVGMLRADQNVLIESVYGDHAGIKWRDKHGTHVMAIPLSKLEVVP